MTDCCYEAGEGINTSDVRFDNTQIHITINHSTHSFLSLGGGCYWGLGQRHG